MGERGVYMFYRFFQCFFFNCGICFQSLNRCLLSTLSPGLIGKLQILKSGQCRLQLGESKMWLELGTQVAFKQVMFHYIDYLLKVWEKERERVRVYIFKSLFTTFQLSM